MTRFFQPYFAVTQTQDQLDGTAYGFYLVRDSDQKRFFISKVVDVLALEEIAQKALNSSVGYDYWIDKSLGKDREGKPAWVNVDHSERFF